MFHLNYITMNPMQRIHSVCCVLTNTILEEHESPVQSGLSLTPAQTLDRAIAGKPVNPPAVDESLFIDSDNAPAYDYGVSPAYQRSVTMSQAWEIEQGARKSVKRAKKTAAKNLAEMQAQLNPE